MLECRACPEQRPGRKPGHFSARMRFRITGAARRGALLLAPNLLHSKRQPTPTTHATARRIHHIRKLLHSRRSERQHDRRTSDDENQHRHRPRRWHPPAQHICPPLILSHRAPIRPPSFHDPLDAVIPHAAFRALPALRQPLQVIPASAAVPTRARQLLRTRRPVIRRAAPRTGPLEIISAPGAPPRGRNIGRCPCRAHDRRFVPSVGPVAHEAQPLAASFHPLHLPHPHIPKPHLSRRLLLPHIMHL